MISITECRKILTGDYSDDEIEQIRDSLYQLANILFDQFQKDKNN